MAGELRKFSVMEIFCQRLALQLGTWMLTLYRVEACTCLSSYSMGCKSVNRTSLRRLLVKLKKQLLGGSTIRVGPEWLTIGWGTFFHKYICLPQQMCGVTIHAHVAPRDAMTTSPRERLLLGSDHRCNVQSRRHGTKLW